jgi:hypothetical protein
LRVDHVVPKAIGGSDDPTNLVAACESCNGGKSSLPPDATVVDDVRQDAIRWARAMEIAGELQVKQIRRRDNYRGAFQDAWAAEGGGRLPSNWTESLDTFNKYGLAMESMIEAVEIAISKRHVPADGLWKYFCGVCWRMLEQQREMAEQIVALQEQEGSR